VEKLVYSLWQGSQPSADAFRDDLLQVLIRDDGPGIDFRTLPKATLVRGFSTASSLGMGFTIMLQSCERVLLATRPGRTSIVLEFASREAGVEAAEVEAS